mgnify:CR=1 FL=1
MMVGRLATATTALGLLPLTGPIFDAYKAILTEAGRTDLLVD